MTDDRDPSEQQAREANEQLQWEGEQALRSALTLGVSMKDMAVLCHLTGIPLQRIIG